jgi:hypothetical protein
MGIFAPERDYAEGTTIPNVYKELPCSFPRLQTGGLTWAK